MALNKAGFSNFSLQNFLIVSGLVFAAALSRLLPHPDNFSPFVALAVFSAFYFKKSWQSLGIPLLALALSDFFLQTYAYAWSVYGTFLIIGVAAKMILRSRFQSDTLLFKLNVIFSGSLFFFLFTNSAYFFYAPEYARSWTGYWSCLTAGIPFYRNAIAGDLFYGAILFGVAALYVGRPATRAQLSRA